MVRAFSVFAFLHFLGSASTFGQGLPQVLEALNHFNKVNLDGPTASCGPEQRPMVPTLGHENTYYSYSRVSPPPFSRTDCRNFGIDWFCERITARSPHRVINPHIQFHRLMNQDLRRRVFAHVDGYFHSLLLDHEILEGCCGYTEPRSRCGRNCSRNQGCQDHLRQTQLKVIPATSPDDTTAYYDGNSNQIRLSEAMLVNALTPETNERTVLHELGHACQLSRHLTPGPNHWSVALDTLSVRGCDNDNGGYSDFAEVLPGVGACLRASLTQAADHWHSEQSEKPCRNSWAMEAFADSIFAFHSRTPMSWNWTCNSLTDVLHGPARLTMECILSQAPTTNISPRPPLLESICN